MLFSILGSSSLAVVVVQPDEGHANRIASVLKWYDRHRVIVKHLVQTKKKMERILFIIGINQSI